MITMLKRPFPGGIHPDGHKDLTAHNKIRKDIKPKRLFLSLQQRNGTILRPLVGVGESVGKGQLLAKGISDMCVPLHSPVNGIVEDIKQHVTAHPSGLKCKTLVIKSNDNPLWAVAYPPCNVTKLSPQEMLQRVLDAGIVGLGGAGFPSGIKLRLARQKKIHTLLINGGECEPYITCDDRLMQESAADIVAGVDIMLTITGAKQAIIAIEDNKPSSIEVIKTACDHLDTISVQAVPSLYPMGSERHLVKAVTGRLIPPGQLSVALGILVHNVATAKSVYHAVSYRRPLIDRVITISGGGIEQPGNFVVPIGTPIADLLGAAGGLKVNAERLIAGGPMMGQIIRSTFAPVDKSIGAVLALSDTEVKPQQSHECVRCGRCVTACPMGLMPFQMASHTRISDFEGAQDYGIDHCLLCGACAYVCPSRIPLTQYFHHAKGAINAIRQMANKSTVTRKLAVARSDRLEKEAEAKKAAKAAKTAKRRRPARRAKEKEV
ncbi:electron transport complex subunit RsxC [Echinimonas agarilytica]|uniref:Ion-translocating oxidoreductase complex subunit C n=1 Tax=Echinimonas agarilytica TaxID=1215918 RepID=A0AA42B810_9GAMM|nr:electron transport complex subunit RsxC [Echinimonas agarilytica]MCM2680452.1 electron transport complex subunit RsxC [Echinimonas agarilytica]